MKLHPSNLMILYAGFSALLILSGCNSHHSVTLQGELKTWHTLTLSFEGPEVSEQSYPNPFLNYRLNVEFTNETDTFTQVRATGSNHGRSPSLNIFAYENDVGDGNNDLARILIQFPMTELSGKIYTDLTIPSSSVQYKLKILL